MTLQRKRVLDVTAGAASAVVPVSVQAVSTARILVAFPDVRAFNSLPRGKVLWNGMFLTVHLHRKSGKKASLQRVRVDVFT